MEQGSPRVQTQATTNGRRPSNADSAAKPLPITPTASTAPQTQDVGNVTAPPSSFHPSSLPASPAPISQYATIASMPKSSASGSGAGEDGMYANANASEKDNKGSATVRERKTSRHRKGLSMDKLGLAKIFSPSGGPASASAREEEKQRVPSDTSGTTSISQAPSSVVEEKEKENKKPENSSRLSLTSGVSATVKAARRNTLNSLFGGRSGNKKRDASVEPTTPRTAKKNNNADMPPPPAPPQHQHQEPPRSAIEPVQTSVHAAGNFNRSRPSLNLGVPAPQGVLSRLFKRRGSRDDSAGPVLSPGVDITYMDGASTSTVDQDRTATPLHDQFATMRGAPSGGVDIGPPTPSKGGVASSSDVGARGSPRAPGHPTRTASNATEHSFSQRMVKRATNIIAPAAPVPKNVLRIHHGALDPDVITTRPPPEVMAGVRGVLDNMGVQITVEGEFKYRCVRPKMRRSGGFLGGAKKDGQGQNGGGLAAVNVAGSAASNGVDGKGLPAPPLSSSFTGTGGMLKGLLMRRQSSQVSYTMSPGPNSASLVDSEDGPNLTADMTAGDVLAPTVETIYGDPSQDARDEVRFYVELTRMDRLKDTFSLDIRRLKGNLRSYKFLYDTVRQ